MWGDVRMLSGNPLIEFDCQLLCAACGCNYTHFHSVEIFKRTEDEETGLHILVTEMSAATDTAMTGNPSARRDAVRIVYSCEFCNQLTTVSFIQHKGNTYVEYGFRS